MKIKSLVKRIVCSTLAIIAVSTAGVTNKALAADDSKLLSMEELRIGAQTLPKTLDANASVSNAGIQVYYNIYDTLIFREPFSDKLTFKPGLAKSWKQVDELTWEIELRENVKFHDGSIMTAEDVAYSYNRVINLKDPSYATTKSYLFSNFEKFEAKGPLTLIAKTKKNEPLFEHLLSDANGLITSKAYVEKVGIDAAALKPISTAPYKVVSFDPGKEVVLERFEEYWGDKAPFKKVTFKLIPEISSRETALMNNEVDLITNIPPDQEVVFNGKDTVKLVGGVLPMYHIYRFNMSNPITDDPKLRQALDLAIDRKGITDSIWLGKAVPATTYQFSSLGSPLYFQDMDNNISFDIEKAKKLLAESDYKGEVINIYNTTDYYTYADLTAQAVVEMWKEIGVNAKLVQVDSLSSVPKEDMELRTWSNPLYYEDPMGVIERHWAPEGEASLSKDFIPNDEYNKQFEIARFSNKVEDRVAALKKMQEFYRAQTPYIYLYMPFESLAMNKAIDYKIPVHLRAHILALRSGEIKVIK